MNVPKKKIFFINCFTDTKKFKLSSNKLKKEVIFGYIGNVGLSYDFKKVLNFLEIYNKINTKWKLIFVNNYLKQNEKKILFENFSLRKKIIISNSKFDKIYEIYEKINFGLYFLKNDFSKIASCPTKLGEMLSSGIPVITNGGIGDIELYLDNKRKSGFLINIINKKKIENINNYILKNDNYNNLKKNAKFIADKFFEKNKSILLYNKIYKELF